MSFILFHLILFLVLLILSSMYPRLECLASDFYVALYDHDIPRLKYIAGCFVQDVGKVIALRLAMDLLGRAVSPPFFFLGYNS